MSAEGGVQPLEVWRGAVNPWLCDEMGHMNMRYYIAIAEEGLAALASSLGQPRAFAAGAVSTLRLRGCHVRFLREARAADSLHATAGVLSMGEDDARLLQVIRHADGSPSATVVCTAQHVTADGRPFAWSARAQAAAAALTCALPDTAEPRSVAPLGAGPSGEGPSGAKTRGAPPPSLARAEALGLRCIARGAVAGAECDAFGQMTATAIFGRVSDGMAALAQPLRSAVAKALPGTRVGGAALEYRLELRRNPRAGDLIAVYSGFARIEQKILHLRHWLLDPAGGEAYGALDGVGATLDLDARRILAVPEAVRGAFVTPGLA